MTSSPYVLETCRGVKPSGCAHALPLPGSFVAALEALVAAAPLPPGLTGLGRPVRHHERFRLSLCACPNGCARPHVADLGLVAVVAPAVSPRDCTGCGACIDVCPDAAMTLAGDVAVVDSARCRGCGTCAGACPAGAIACRLPALRALVGGRLGRRPRLGVEPAGRFSPDAALGLARRCIEAFSREMRPGLRFGDVVFPGGLPGLPAWVLS